jgi:hypothetical protein
MGEGKTGSMPSVVGEKQPDLVFLDTVLKKQPDLQSELT